MRPPAEAKKKCGLTRASRDDLVCHDGWLVTWPIVSASGSGLMELIESRRADCNPR